MESPEAVSSGSPLLQPEPPDPDLGRDAPGGSSCSSSPPRPSTGFS
uniref:Uncharacterized protein n=1 Tax=Brassica campestris TaxID=3711 RepID=A0A3P5ZAA7_BRACM|nr:unnamed protein product [Brassica rapa]